MTYTVRGKKQYMVARTTHEPFMANAEVPLHHSNTQLASNQARIQAKFSLADETVNTVLKTPTNRNLYWKCNYYFGLAPPYEIPFLLFIFFSLLEFVPSWKQVSKLLLDKVKEKWGETPHTVTVSDRFLQCIHLLLSQQYWHLSTKNTLQLWFFPHAFQFEEDAFDFMV